MLSELCLHSHVPYAWSGWSSLRGFFDLCCWAFCNMDKAMNTASSLAELRAKGWIHSFCALWRARDCPEPGLRAAWH
jgi:hypothetical protein